MESPILTRQSFSKAAQRFRLENEIRKTFEKQFRRDKTTLTAGAKGKGTMAGDPSELEWAIQTLVKNYDKYANRGCCCRRVPGISKNGFRKMLSHELNHMLTDTKNKQAADKLICDLDENQDGQISFDEYWNLIGGIASPISCLIRQQEESVKFTK